VGYRIVGERRRSHIPRGIGESTSPSIKSIKDFYGYERINNGTC
jgi:hypothetical protein